MAYLVDKYQMQNQEPCLTKDIMLCDKYLMAESRNLKVDPETLPYCLLSRLHINFNNKKIYIMRHCM